MASDDQNNTLFLKKFHGSLRNLLTWADWDAFVARLQSPNAGQSDGWYVYAVAENLPTAPLSASDFQIFLKEINDLLKKEHQEKYCGIVYVDDLNAPTLVKIYDPNNLGAVCGSSGEAVLPGWVLSRMPPDALTPPVINPLNRQNFWQNLQRLWKKDR